MDVQSWKGPSLGLMLCCHHFEIFNNFLTRGPSIYILPWVPQIMELVPAGGLASGQLPGPGISGD